MQDRTAGHPLGALLIIIAIFAVALIFSVATPPGPSIAVNVAVAVTPPPAPVETKAPAVVQQVAVPATSRGAGPSAPANESQAAVNQQFVAPAPVETQTVSTPVLEIANTPLGPEPLAAFSWSTMPSRYPMTAVRAGVDVPVTSHDHGAVTGALASAGSAVRSAFKKAF